MQHVSADNDRVAQWCAAHPVLLAFGLCAFGLAVVAAVWGFGILTPATATVIAFIYAPDQHDFFAVTVAAMSQLNLNIHDARIITSSSQFTLDTYIVLDNDGGSIGDNPQRVRQIRDGLTEALRNPEDYPTIIQRRVPRQLKHFDFPPQVTILNDAQRPVTILEITAPDRPGLLARLGRIFLEFDLSLQNAKIATLGERVEDVFFITDADNQPLSDPQLCSRLQEAIVQQLQAGQGSDTSPTRVTF